MSCERGCELQSTCGEVLNLRGKSTKQPRLRDGALGLGQCLDASLELCQRPLALLEGLGALTQPLQGSALQGECVQVCRLQLQRLESLLQCQFWIKGQVKRRLPRAVGNELFRLSLVNAGRVDAAEPAKCDEARCAHAVVGASVDAESSTPRDLSMSGTER